MTSERGAMEQGAVPHLVVGTAGHIDHGKTSLIGALTGVETDRLPEEKARGITIDLGFAELELPSGLRLSVVDVPGHEGLVRTMVSGATGIDLMLLVVAADEGVMPQTREHVAICDLLGMQRAVVALTKIDLVDDEMIELASEEVADLLEPTGMTGAPIVPVSKESGAGIDALRDALERAARQTDPRTTREGPPRLCVDRRFAIKGFGTVVTGTLVGAPLAGGDAVTLLPRDLHSKVRGLQSHGQECKRVDPGTRCAVNLQGVEVVEIGRGDVLTLPDTMTCTQSADVRLDWLPSSPESEGNIAVEFLTGTSERRAHLAPIGTRTFAAGTTLFARLHIDGEAVALLPGDRFIVRGFARGDGAGATLGGGSILDVAPPHRRRSDPDLLRELEVIASGDAQGTLLARITRTGFAGADAREIARELGQTRGDLDARLARLREAGDAIPAGPHLWLGTSFIERMQAELLRALAAFHAAEPMRPGMPRAALRGALPRNVPGEASELALGGLEASGDVIREGDLVRARDHVPTFTEEAKQALETIVQDARTAGLDPPNPKDWADRLRIGLDHFRDLVAHLERQDSLVRAPGDLWFDRAAIDELVARVRAHFETNEELDTQTYKALIGTSRRTAMPLMELLDDLHITRRQGEVRVLRGGGERAGS